MSTRTITANAPCVATNIQSALDSIPSAAPSAATKAAREYISRRSRGTHPAGDFDAYRRFTLDPSEICDCCTYIRAPSKRFPFSQMVHARTLKHVAHMFGIPEKDVRAAVQQIEGTR